MALSAAQTPILLIILIIISSIIGGLILVICATVICKHCYKKKTRKEIIKNDDTTISKSQSTITIYKNRKASRIDSVTATEIDEESITALVKKYKDTIDRDHCDLISSTGSVKNLFKVLTPTKETADVFIETERNHIQGKDCLMKDSSCQTFITLEDVIFTEKCSINSEDVHTKMNKLEMEPIQNTKIDEMHHIVPLTDYRRSSQHLRPFDTHWGSNTLSRSFDQMPDKNYENQSRKTYSFDECETNPEPIKPVIRTNSFDVSGKNLSMCKRQVSVTSGQSSKTSSSISTLSISQNYHENSAGGNPTKYSTVSSRVRSYSKLGKDISSVNSSFNSSSDTTNHCMIRSSHEINRPLQVNDNSRSYRRKCNSERSPVRKVVVTRVTSKSLESRENTWQPSDNVEIQTKLRGRSFVINETNYPNHAIKKQNSVGYPGIAKYPSSQYRQTQFIRHKSIEVSKNINDRHKYQNNSYYRINTKIEKSHLSLESDETLDRNVEPHLSLMGLVNISLDNSEPQFSNVEIIPDLLNHSVKDEKHYRDSVHRPNRNLFQSLCRSNISLETSNNLSTTAAIRRRQFSQERRKGDLSHKDSKGSLSKSVYDDYSSFMLDNLDDKKGKSMILDRFFSSQMIPFDNPDPMPNKFPTKHQFAADPNENKDFKFDDNRVDGNQTNFSTRCSTRIRPKYFRAKSQNIADSSDRWNTQPVLYNDNRSNIHPGNGKNQMSNRRQLSEKDTHSKSIDRTIPTIVFSQKE